MYYGSGVGCGHTAQEQEVYMVWTDFWVEREAETGQNEGFISSIGNEFLGSKRAKIGPPGGGAWGGILFGGGDIPPKGAVF